MSYQLRLAFVISLTALMGCHGEVIVVGVDSAPTTTSTTTTTTIPNTAPTISDVANQSVAAGSATSALTFTIGDGETAAGSLSVSGSSSNTTLVPNANIVFGGSGASRTVTVTPASGQVGTATITITVSDGALSTSDTFTLTVTGKNLEVPIEMIDAGIASVMTGATTFNRTRTTLETTDYDGSPAYFFEVVAINEDAVARDIDLINASDAVVGTVTVPPTTMAATRIRNPFTPTAGINNYRVRTPQSTAGMKVRVHAARMIVRQVNATKTKLYIPLANWGHNQSDLGENALYPDANLGATYGQAEPKHYSMWRKDSSKFATLAAGNPWTLEVVIRTNAGTAYAALFNRTSNTMVAGTEITTPNTSNSLYTVPFADNAVGFTDLNEFEVRIHGNGTTQSTYLQKAGLWVKLENLSKGEVYHRVSQHSPLDTNFTLTNQRMQIDTSQFSNPTVYFEVVAQRPTAPASAFLLGHGNNDAGAGGASTVASSTHNLVMAKTRYRSPALTITSGDRFITGLASTSGDINNHVTSSFVVVGFQ